MDLDFSIILHNRKAAVHCRTYEQARAFCDYMKEHYPQKTHGAFDLNWHRYGGDTCFSPYFPSKTNGMTYCPIDHYVREGFDIVEFERLQVCADSFETELSSEPIEFLLGI